MVFKIIISLMLSIFINGVVFAKGRKITLTQLTTDSVITAIPDPNYNGNTQIKNLLDYLINQNESISTENKKLPINFFIDLNDKLTAINNSNYELIKTNLNEIINKSDVSQLKELIKEINSLEIISDEWIDNNICGDCKNILNDINKVKSIHLSKDIKTLGDFVKFKEIFNNEVCSAINNIKSFDEQKIERKYHYYTLTKTYKNIMEIKNSINFVDICSISSQITN